MGDWQHEVATGDKLLRGKLARQTRQSAQVSTSKRENSPSGPTRKARGSRRVVPFDREDSPTRKKQLAAKETASKEAAASQQQPKRKISKPRQQRKNSRERQRRMELNDQFERLRELLNLDEKCNKTQILSDAIDLICDLKKELKTVSQTKSGRRSPKNKASRPAVQRNWEKRSSEDQEDEEESVDEATAGGLMAPVGGIMAPIAIGPTDDMKSASVGHGLADNDPSESNRGTPSSSTTTAIKGAIKGADLSMFQFGSTLLPEQGPVVGAYHMSDLSDLGESYPVPLESPLSLDNSNSSSGRGEQWLEDFSPLTTPTGHHHQSTPLPHGAHGVAPGQHHQQQMGMIEPGDTNWVGQLDFNPMSFQPRVAVARTGRVQPAAHRQNVLQPQAGGAGGAGGPADFLQNDMHGLSLDSDREHGSGTDSNPSSQRSRGYSF